MAWLNRVWNEGIESEDALDPLTGDCPWYWKKTNVSLKTLVKYYSLDFGYAPKPQEEIKYLQDSGWEKK